MKSPQKPREVQSLTSKITALSRFVSRATDRCLSFFDALKGPKQFERSKKCKHTFQELKRHMGQLPLLSKLIDGEKFYIYLVVSQHMVSAALVHEEEKVQWLVYYVSKCL